MHGIGWTRLCEPTHTVRSAVWGAIAIASFLFAAGWIRSAIPWTEDYGLRAKVEAFANTKNEYDAVYLGSSNVFRAPATAR